VKCKSLRSGAKATQKLMSYFKS